jgi:ssRNA-specific RNase YbeY (16S rRNA maturation enzyme)
VQAAEFGHGRVDEVQILMLHGLSHLAGMDHKTDRGEMARAENKWREELGLPTSLIFRSRLNGQKK